MALEGKRINELTEVSKVDTSSKLAIDTGGEEALSITLKNLIDSSGIGGVDIATTEKAGIVKPDGTTISVSSDGTISSSGSGFDFEGTKAEFNAAVAAGTITEDSVSLITDDVSGDNVATKAELQNKVSKAGDTMTGPLKMFGNNEVRFGTDDNYYYIQKESNGNFTIRRNDNKGIFFDPSATPYYFDSTNSFRLLTTADLSQQVNPIRLNYSAQVSGGVVVAPSNGFIFARGSYNDTNYELKVEDPSGTIIFALSIGYNNDGPTCCSVPVTTGQKAYITPGSQVIFVPYY